MKSGTSLLVAALLLVAVVASAVAGALALGVIPPLTGGEPTATPGATASPRPSETPTASPSASPTTSPTPASSPSSAPPSDEPRPTPGGTYVVQEGDTLFGIGELFGIPWELIAEANQLEEPFYIFPGQELDIPLPPEASPGALVYVIQPGDTFYDIAYQLDVSPEALAEANGITDINDIKAGDVLVIPGATSSPSLSPTP